MPGISACLRAVCPLALGVLLPAAAWCQADSWKLVSVGPTKVKGQFDAIIQLGSKAPAFDQVKTPGLWRITVYEFASGASGPIVERAPVTILNVLSVPPDPFKDNELEVILDTDARYVSVDAGVPRLYEVRFLGGSPVATLWNPSTMKPDVAAPSAGAPAPAVSSSGGGSTSTPTSCGTQSVPVLKDGFNLNYCLSGIWVPQAGSHPLYSTNTNFILGYGWTQLGHSSLSLTGQESTSSSTTLDPNAFASAVLWHFTALTTHTRLDSIEVNWDLATVEFDRKKKSTNLGTNVNLITSPQVEFVISAPGYISVTPFLGIEAGHNFKNNINPNGFGAVFRGLTGVQVARNFYPKGLQEIKVSSQYQGRELAENEVITRSVHGVLKPFSGHQTRNWVSTEVDFMFTKNFGITLKHDYGELPPSFIVTENRATVGLTLQSAPAK